MMRRSSNLQRAAVQNAAQPDHFASADLPAGGRPGKIAPRGRVVQLEPFLHRAVLATDGTVTNLIESFLERVMIEKLGEETGTAPIPDWPGLPAGMPIVRRTVLIRGIESGHIFLHAESLLILERLEPSIRGELFATEKPIGKLIREHRCESFRELLGCREEPAGPRALVLGCNPEDRLIARTYRIHFAGQPAIQITERFMGRAEDGEVRSCGGRSAAPPSCDAS